MHFGQLKQAEAVQEMAIVLAVAACPGPESHLQNTTFGKLCSERRWQRCG